MDTLTALAEIVDLASHPLDDMAYADKCRATLTNDGALLLRGFLTAPAIEAVLTDAHTVRHLGYFSEQTHNVYLDPPAVDAPSNQARSRTIVSTKGAVTTDLVPMDSALRAVYDSALFRSFLCQVLGEQELFEYADPLSSININYYEPGQELGWHFDNSSFSVTLLVQSAVNGAEFEFINNMRDAETGRSNQLAVAAVLDGGGPEPTRLGQQPGDLALFRGRNALHRVTPVCGEQTRIQVVLAYNTEPGLSLSENARMTFFGRLD